MSTLYSTTMPPPIVFLSVVRNVPGQFVVRSPVLTDDLLFVLPLQEIRLLAMVGTSGNSVLASMAVIRPAASAKTVHGSSSYFPISILYTSHFA